MVFTSMKTKGNFIKNMSSNWSNLTDAERANVLTTMKEISIALGAFAGTVILAGLGDAAATDEEEQFYYWLALAMSKLKADMTMYMPTHHPVKEFSRNLKNPTSAISTIDNLIGVMEGVFTQERYKTGDHKNELKFWVKFRKLIDPYYRHVQEKDYKKSFTFMENI